MKKGTSLLVFVLFICSHIQGQVGMSITLPDNPSIVITPTITTIDSTVTPNDTTVTTFGTAEIGVATCDGCFSAQSHIGDVIIRTNGMNTGNLILAARSGDGIIFTTGDGNTDTKRLEILNDGKMVIGDVTTPGNYGLYVEKGILSERVKVAIKTEVDWADFVFEDDYQLMPLKTVEEFVKHNKHLPNVPSAKDMTKKGLDVAEMDATLLTKIEELTLYVINLNKEVQQLKKENEQLKNQR